jgi:flagellar biosynthesis/type III secretory pathway protein FliH
MKNENLKNGGLYECDLLVYGESTEYADAGCEKYKEVYKRGHYEGHKDGYVCGWNDACECNDSYDDGYNNGSEDGYNDGYNFGLSNAMNEIADIMTEFEECDYQMDMVLHRLYELQLSLQFLYRNTEEIDNKE